MFELVIVNITSNITTELQWGDKKTALARNTPPPQKKPRKNMHIMKNIGLYTNIVLKRFNSRQMLIWVMIIDIYGSFSDEEGLKRLYMTDFKDLQTLW